MCRFNVLWASSQSLIRCTFLPHLCGLHTSCRILFENILFLLDSFLSALFPWVMNAVFCEVSAGRRAWGSYPQNLILRSLSALPQCPGVSWGGRSHLRRKLSFVILTKRDGKRAREWGGETELLRGGRKKNTSFLLQPVNRLMGASAGMSWYLSTRRERERYT